MATKFRYPTGARPLLIEETARRRRIETRFVALLEDAGFAEVVLPIIDFAEPYAAVSGRAVARQSYRFTDRDGELVAVRSDFTPMVARALAPSLDGALPLRVFYRGDVIRCEATRLGANRELFQIGAELVGDRSEAADVEMLRLAAAIASAFCEDPLVVYSDGPRIDDPRFVEHEETSDRGYYTGVRFWVYGDDRRTPIAQGGRYDTLYAQFGTDAPAIGFTFTVDELGRSSSQLAALSSQENDAVPVERRPLRPPTSLQNPAPEAGAAPQAAELSALSSQLSREPAVDNTRTSSNRPSPPSSVVLRAASCELRAEK